MKHMDRVERLKEMLLHRARTVAVIGASSRRHSGAVVHYLHRAGYDVIPIRPDRVAVDGLPTYARLEDVGGQIDLVAIFRRPDAVKTHISEAASKQTHGVWLPPGTWSREAEEEARRHKLPVVRDSCIMEDHRHLCDTQGNPRAGHPRLVGVL